MMTSDLPNRLFISFSTLENIDIPSIFMLIPSWRMFLGRIQTINQPKIHRSFQYLWSFHSKVIPNINQSEIIILLLVVSPINYHHVPSLSLKIFPWYSLFWDNLWDLHIYIYHKLLWNILPGNSHPGKTQKIAVLFGSCYSQTNTLWHCCTQTHYFDSSIYTSNLYIHNIYIYIYIIYIHNIYIYTHKLFIQYIYT